MGRTKRYAILAIFLFQICSAISEQKITYGLGFDYGRLFNQSNFTAIPTVARPDIPLTEQSPSWNYLISGNIYYYLLNWFKFGLRVDWTNPVFNYRDLESTLISRNGLPEKAVIEHTMQAKFNMLGGEPFIGIVIPEILSVNLGFKFGYNLNTNLTQNEKIIQPTDFAFTKPVGNFTGKIPDVTNILYIPSVRLESETSILKAGNFIFRPEIQFQILLNNLVTGISWKYSNLSAGITISYMPKKRILMPVDSVLFINQPVKIDSFKRGSITQLMAQEDSSKKEIIPENDNVSKGNSKSKSMLFGELSTVFLMHDQNESKGFSITYEKTINHWILPAYSEKNGLISFNGKINKKTDTISQTVIPDIKFYPKVTAEAGLKKWEIILYTGKEELKRLEGELEMPSFVVWETSKQFSNIDLTGKNIEYKFNLEDFENNNVTASTGNINFVQSDRPNGTSYKSKKIIVIPEDLVNYKKFTEIISKAQENKSLKMYYSIYNNNINKNSALESELKKYGEIAEKNIIDILPDMKYPLPAYNYFVVIIE